MLEFMGYIFLTMQLTLYKNPHEIEIQWQFNGNCPCVLYMKDDNVVGNKSMDGH
jgi:hypothetical protein